MTGARTLFSQYPSRRGHVDTEFTSLSLKFEVWFFVFDPLTISQPRETFGHARKTVWCFS